MKMIYHDDTPGETRSGAGMTLYCMHDCNGLQSAVCWPASHGHMRVCMHADEYQPPCFKAADANMVAHFTKKPFTMDVGAVNTNHHNVGLKVGSALRASTDAS